MSEQLNGLKLGQMAVISSKSGTGKSKLCVLLPNTMRLKQVIKEHGNVWVVKHGPCPMQCFGDSDGIGIESLNATHFRNVRVEDVEPWNSNANNWGA